MQIKDKLIAITGAGKGIGRAMALMFAARGANLALLDVNDTDLQQTAADCKSHSVNVKTYHCNVAVEADVVSAFAQIAGDFARFDILVNNAGILRDGMLIKQDGDSFKKLSLAQWQAVIDVNLTGVFLCGREAAEHMIRFANGGVIINLSSISRAGNVGQSNYAAAKAGVAALTVVWAKELSRHGIRTGAIAPGFIHTEILNAMPEQILQNLLSQVPLRRGGQPDEVAQAALFIAENDYFSGRVIELDGGLRL